MGFAVSREIRNGFKTSRKASMHAGSTSRGFDKVVHWWYEISLRIRDKRLTFRARIIQRPAIDSWLSSEHFELVFRLISPRLRRYTRAAFNVLNRIRWLFSIVEITISTPSSEEGWCDYFGSTSNGPEPGLFRPLRCNRDSCSINWRRWMRESAPASRHKSR